MFLASFLWRPKPGVTITPEVSHLWYRQIKFPHAGWPVLFVVMFVVWSGPLHVPGGSHVGELPVRWLWNPGERRGNPRWMSSQFGGRCNIGIRGAQCAPSWVCVDPLTALTARCRVEEWRTHFESFHVTQSTPAFFPRHQTPVTPPHATPRAQRKQSCRGTELLAI